MIVSHQHVFTYADIFAPDVETFYVDDFTILRPLDMALSVGVTGGRMVSKIDVQRFSRAVC